MSFSFRVEWEDEQADLVREYQLSYFIHTDGNPNEASMYDIKQRRQFLAKYPCPNIELSSLYIGGTVML